MKHNIYYTKRSYEMEKQRHQVIDNVLMYNDRTFELWLRDDFNAANERFQYGKVN